MTRVPHVRNAVVRWIAVSVGVVLIAATSITAVSASTIAPKLDVSLVNIKGQNLGTLPLLASLEDGFGILIQNDGSAATSNVARATIDLSLPAGERIVEMYTLGDTASQKVAATWRCTPATDTTLRCVATAASPEVLAPGQSAAVVVVLSNHLGAGDDPGSAVTVAVHLAGARVGRATVPAPIVASAAQLDSVLTAPQVTVGAGGAGEVEFALRNMGTPATADPHTKTTGELTHLLPPGVAATWSSDSPGWACVGAPDRSPTCSYVGPSLAYGATSAPLVVSYRVLAGSASGVRAWHASFSAPTPYGNVRSVALPMSVKVVPHLTDKIAVKIGTLGGQTVTATSNRPFEVVQLVTGGAPDGLTDTVVLGPGIVMSPVDEYGWTCPGGESKVVCHYAAPIDRTGTTGFIGEIHSLSSAKPGLSIVGVEAQINGGGPKNANISLLEVEGPHQTTTKSGSSRAPPSQAKGGGSSGAGSQPVPLGPPAKTHHATVSQTATLTAQSTPLDHEQPESVSPLADTAPAAPTGVKATVSSGTVTVSWTAPSNGGSAITDYIVTNQAGTTVCTTTALNCKPTGDSAGQVYAYRVRAKNAIGTGAYSSYSNAVAPSGAVVLATFTLSPTSLSVSASARFTMAGTITIGSTPVTVSVSYMNSTNWSVTASTGTFSLASSVSVTITSLTISDNASGEDGISGDTTDHGVEATINGTMSVLGASIAVAVTYTSTTTWSVALTASAISLGSVGSMWLAGSVSDSAGTLSSTVTVTTGTSTTPAQLNLGGGVTLEGSLSVAYSSTASAPTATGSLTLAVGTALSLPVSFSYSSSTDWSISVTGATLTFLSATLGISGTLAESSSGLSGVLTLMTGTGGTSTPISLGGGVTLGGSLTFAYSSTASSPSFTGNLVLTITSGLSLDVTMGYTDSTHWTLTVAASSNTGGFTIAPGLTIPLDSFSGTLSDNGSGVQWSISATVGPITLVSNVVTLTTLTLTLGSSCPMGESTFCTGDSDTFFIAISGSVSFTSSISGSSQTYTGTVSAILGLPSGRFDLSATINGTIGFSSAGVSVSLTNPTLEIGYNDPNFGTLSSIASGISFSTSAAGTSGLSILLSGSTSITILGNSLSLNFAILITSSGFIVAASFPNGFTIDDTGATVDALAYSSVASTITMNGQSVQLPAGTFVLSGSVTMPAPLAQYLNITAPVLSIYVIYTSTTDWSINAVIPESASISTGSSDFAFSFNNMTLSIADLGGTISITAAENGTLTISGSADDGGTDVINLQLAITISTTGLTFSASANGVNGQPIWSNVMGLDGLNIDSLTVAFGVTFEGPLPSIGLSASGTLPGSLLQDLGMGNGNNIPITFAANISDTNPCVQVTIGTPPTDGTPGPTIINIGGVVTASYASLVAAPDGCMIGTFSIQPGFQIAFDGTFLGVAISVQATLTSNPFSFSATVTISGFSIGPFSSTGDSLSISITPTSFSLAFSGNISIDDVGTVTLAGSFDSTGAFNFTGTANINIGSFSLNINVVANGNIDDLSSVTVQASAMIEVVGVDLDLQGNFSSPDDFSLSVTADFDPGGFDLGNLMFTFSVNGADVSFTASASVDLGGVFTGSLNGTFNATPSGVAFYFSITVGFTVDGYTIVGGSLSVGNCTDSTCDSVGEMQASLSFTFLDATVNVTVSSDWSFNWDALAASLKKTFGDAYNTVVTYMNDLGANAQQIGNALQNDFDLTATQITDAFQSAGVALSNALSDAYDVTAQDAAEVLQSIGYTVDEIATALQTTYAQVAQETAQILEDIGNTANEVATALDNVYQEAAQEAAMILEDVGYTVDQIGQALEGAYQELAQGAAQILDDLSYDASQVASALQYAYNEAAEETAQILTDIGYGIDDIATALDTVFQEADAACAQILNEIGASFQDISNALDSVYQDVDSAVASILNSLGATYNEIANDIYNTFSDTAQDLANILDSLGASATEAYNDLSAIFTSLSTSAWESILSVAGWASSAIDAIGSAFESFGQDLEQAGDAIVSFFDSL